MGKNNIGKDFHKIYRNLALWFSPAEREDMGGEIFGLGPVQRMDNDIHRINYYPVDKC